MASDIQELLNHDPDIEVFNVHVAVAKRDLIEHPVETDHQIAEQLRRIAAEIDTGAPRRALYGGQ